MSKREEKNNQSKIIKYLRKEGFYVIPLPRNSMTQAGIPDILAFNKNRHIFFEIKAKKGVLREVQIVTINNLKKYSEVYVVQTVEDVEKIVYEVDNE